MNLQYITDDNGETTGVFIPIQEWNELKTKLKSIGQGELEVPEWQKAIVRERMETYKKNPERALDFDVSMKEIEKDL